MQNTLILASGSSRRNHLLSMLGVEFVTKVSNFDEHAVKMADFADLGDYVSTIATGKVMQVAGQLETDHNEVVIGGDLLCFGPGGKQMGKPRDFAQAKEFVDTWSGSWHHEISAICIWSQEKGLRRSVDHIDILLPPLTEEEKSTYLQISQPLDKAGGFNLRAYARMLRQRGEDPQTAITIRGLVSGIVGFPLTPLAQLLKDYSILVSADPKKVEQDLIDFVFKSEKNGDIL